MIPAAGAITLFMVVATGGFGDAAVIFSRKEVIEGVTFRKAHLFLPSEPDRPIWRDKLGIDILMMADHSQYEAFLEMANGDHDTAVHYVNEYMATILDQVRRIFADFHEAFAFELRLVGTFIATRTEDCPLKTPLVVNENDEYGNSTWTNATLPDAERAEIENGNSTEMSLSLSSADALARLTAWIKTNYDLLPTHDHAIMLTKFDLLTAAGDSATQGIAYVKMMCKPGDSSSVVEDVGGMATAVIAAHEMAHRCDTSYL